MAGSLLHGFDMALYQNRAGALASALHFRG
jgi:hypothetical protein